MRKSADEVTRMEGNCRRVRNCVPVRIPSGSRRAPGPERQRVGQTPGERASFLRGYDSAPSTRLRREAIGPWQGSGAAVSAQRVLMAPTSLGRAAALDAPSRRARQHAWDGTSRQAARAPRERHLRAVVGHEASVKQHHRHPRRQRRAKTNSEIGQYKAHRFSPPKREIWISVSCRSADHHESRVAPRPGTIMRRQVRRACAAVPNQEH